MQTMCRLKRRDCYASGRTTFKETRRRVPFAFLCRCFNTYPFGRNESRICSPSPRFPRRPRTAWAGRQTWRARPWKPGRLVVMLTSPSFREHNTTAARERRLEQETVARRRMSSKSRAAAALSHQRCSSALNVTTWNTAAPFKVAALCASPRGMPLPERTYSK